MLRGPSSKYDPGFDVFLCTKFSLFLFNPRYLHCTLYRLWAVANVLCVDSRTGDPQGQENYPCFGHCPMRGCIRFSFYLCSGVLYTAHLVIYQPPKFRVGAYTPLRGTVLFYFAERFVESATPPHLVHVRGNPTRGWHHPICWPLALCSTSHNTEPPTTLST